MPEPHRPTDRTPDERSADHAGLGRLSETLVPALVAKLNGSGLGELEVREGDWRIRLRRSAASSTAHRRAERPRVTAASSERRDAATHATAAAAATASAEPAPNGKRALATSPAVGVFRPVAKVGGTVRQGDRLAVVDLLGIPQDVVSPLDGVLTEVFIEAGQAVEYGEPVAAVEAPPEPAASATPGREG